MLHPILKTVTVTAYLLILAACNNSSVTGIPDVQSDIDVPPIIDVPSDGEVLTGPGTRSNGFVPNPADQITFTEQEMSLEMRDGVVIKATEYVPEGVGEVPTIVYFYPYGRNANLAGGPSPDNYMARYGYAELVVDVRGTGASGGVWQLYSEAEIADYQEIINWAIDRPHSDGQIILSGQSYAAIAALLAASRDDTGAVKAIFARVPAADLYRDLAGQGGSSNVGFLSWWSTSLVGGPSVVQPLLGEEVDVLTTMEHVNNFFTSVLPTYLSLLLGDDNSYPPQLTGGQEGAFDSDWYRLRSPMTLVDQIDVPTFLIGAQFDIFQRAQPILFNALDLPPSQKKMVVVPDYHIFQPKWLSSDDGSRTVRDNAGNIIPSENNLRLAWYDRHTKGRKNGIDELPTETYYFSGNSVAKSFKEGVPQVEPTRFFINPEPPALMGAAGAGTLQGTPLTQGGWFEMLFQPDSGACSRMPIQYLAGEVPDVDACSTNNVINELDAWNFTTAPFDETTRIFGPGNLRLWISSTATEAQIVAFLTDVAPDGTSTQVSFGQLIASHRALDETPCSSLKVEDCSVYIDGELIQPWHPYTKKAQSPLTVGQLYEIQIEMNPAFMELKPGHRLRLSIKTGNSPAFNPAPPIRAAATGGVTTVISDPSHPSMLVLGILR
jgi:putative CocE/NonD family hydrolase